ncbi:Bug family tripartite tricarboxylate transporter substrate binding protein [Pararoseomonas indoligenes]|uniref:Tripartite tricarboxylate transporter substrate binding protein n=1 Tax=Roseomonas indoligenes TaxID=2820811 RepID=A0A940S9C3_9PROT|nr:tripartite tricarboxylate transporter substrate binding protein [Pararoseomonas indoligenes]MBP0494997.1 tripartite tricarboxylate transporter substrate binding protein [Pararoseomonas indoligenes]
MRRRHLLLSPFAALPAAAWGQAYPSKPIRIIVPVPPGGGTDIITRLVQPGLQERLGQPVLIENRPGGGSTIGTNLVAQAPADGHTLLMIDSAVAVNPFLYARLPFDTERDLQPVSLLATAPVILVAHPSFPPRTVKEVLDYAHAHPGAVNFASGGNGASTHLAGEMLRSVAKLDIVHVPYAGTAPGVTAVLGGQTQIMFAGISSTRQYVEGGQLRAIAITGNQRSPALPDVPTFAEAGLPEMNAETIWGLWAPAATPLAIGERLSREIAAVLALPDIRAKAAELGFVLAGTTPAEFSARFRRELDTWGPIVRQSGARAG